MLPVTFIVINIILGIVISVSFGVGATGTLEYLAVGIIGSLSVSFVLIIILLAAYLHYHREK
jgi:hypothetical protein